MGVSLCMLEGICGQKLTRRSGSGLIANVQDLKHGKYGPANFLRGMYFTPLILKVFITPEMLKFQRLPDKGHLALGPAEVEGHRSRS